MIVPCHKCEKRESGCHSRCPDYAKYKKEIEDARHQHEERVQLTAWEQDKKKRLRRR